MQSLVAAGRLQKAEHLSEMQKPVLEPEGSAEVGQEREMNSEQTCACGEPMRGGVCSDPECRYNVPRVTKYEIAALDAISAGRSMADMLQLLPANTPKDELQRYSSAYADLRRRNASAPPY